MRQNGGEAGRPQQGALAAHVGARQQQRPCRSLRGAPRGTVRGAVRCIVRGQAKADVVGNAADQRVPQSSEIQ